MIYAQKILKCTDSFEISQHYQTCSKILTSPMHKNVHKISTVEFNLSLNFTLLHFKHALT